MSKIFLTSGTFFGRKSLVRDGIRDFEKPIMMNKYIIEKWNSTVNDDDIVFFLGNFAWEPITAENFLGKLNGTIHFLLGEHDHCLIELHQFKSSEKFTLIPKDIYYYEEENLILSYWPLHRWPNMDKVINVYGMFSKDQENLKEVNRICVNQDLFDFRPVEIEAIREFIEISRED